MMARSHVVIGAAAWITVAPLLHLPPWDPVTLGLAMAGSLLPDIDHPKSWVGQRSRPLSTLLAAIFGHRGMTHSLAAAFGMAALLLHLGTRRGWVCGLAVGYLSHLAADMLTPAGLRLAWPLRGNWGLPLCRAGSPAEPVIVAGVMLATAWLCFTRGGGRVMVHLPPLLYWTA